MFDPPGDLSPQIVSESAAHAMLALGRRELTGAGIAPASSAQSECLKAGRAFLSRVRSQDGPTCPLWPGRFRAETVLTQAEPSQLRLGDLEALLCDYKSICTVALSSYSR